MHAVRTGQCSASAFDCIGNWSVQLTVPVLLACSCPESARDQDVERLDDDDQH